MNTKPTLPKILLFALVAALGVAARAEQPADALLNTPPLPTVYFRDIKTYAYVWDGAQWQILPRNEARIFDGKGYDGLPSNAKKQLTGKLLLDGCYAVPRVSGENVILVYRGKFKTFEGLPENESGIEVVKLQVEPGIKEGTLIRTAHLERLGKSAATFGEKRESITVQETHKHDGVFHVVHVNGILSPGRYALYMPDRAFEFEVK